MLNKPHAVKFHQSFDNLVYCNKRPYLQGVGGVMVSIVAFQAVDPSSILGHRTSFALSDLLITISFASFSIQLELIKKHSGYVPKRTYEETYS